MEGKSVLEKAAYKEVGGFHARSFEAIALQAAPLISTYGTM